MDDRSRRLVEVVLDEQTVARRSAEVEHERAVAINDLIEESAFALGDGTPGPYRLRLAIVEGRRRFDVRDGDDQALSRVLLPLSPFRSLIRDYFTVCEAYYEAIKTATRARIEAIDMGRRGLHDEGAELLRAQLAPSIEIDETTARRLFTLVCVLHVRG